MKENIFSKTYNVKLIVVIELFDEFKSKGYATKIPICEYFNFKIDFSYFNSGIYFVKVFLSEHVKTVKIIKK